MPNTSNVHNLEFLLKCGFCFGYQRALASDGFTSSERHRGAAVLRR